jgi:hypothetical protein
VALLFVDGLGVGLLSESNLAQNNFVGLPTSGAQTYVVLPSTRFSLFLTHESPALIAANEFVGITSAKAISSTDTW